MRSSVPAERLTARYWQLDRFPAYMHYKELGLAYTAETPIYGLSIMFMLASLANDVRTFNIRQRDLDYISPSDLKFMIETTKQRLVNTIAALKETYSNEISREAFNQKVETAKSEMTGFDQTLLSAEAFYCAVSLIQDAIHYKHIFRASVYRHDQRMNHLLPLITPEAVIQKGGAVDICTLLSTYTVEELYLTLKSFRDQLISYEMDAPVALYISSTTHCNVLTFDPCSHSWQYYDAKNYVSQTVTTAAAAELIHRAHTKTEFAVLKSQLFTTGHHAALLDYIFKNWKTTPEFKSVHDLRKDNILRADSNHITMLHHACSSGMPILVQNLLNLGANPNYRHPRSLMPMLDIALESGADQCAVILINHPATDIQNGDQNGETPLHKSIRRGLHAAFKALIDRGANLTAANRNGETPLQLIHQCEDRRFHATIYPPEPQRPVTAPRFFAEAEADTDARPVRTRKKSKKSSDYSDNDSPYLPRK